MHEVYAALVIALRGGASGSFFVIYTVLHGIAAESPY
jgi:hypothetical protein